MTERKIVAVSGGFDPLHVGHVRMLKEAKQLGNELVVILNNDAWLAAKKGGAFMPARERKEVLEALCFVDRVILTDHEPGGNYADPEYRSVCKVLRELRPHVFANGGDRKPDGDPVPEVALCEELGIEMVYNVGGDKVQSSSWLTQRVRETAALAQRKGEELASIYREIRPWGYFEVLADSKDKSWTVKTLHLNTHVQLSVQSHQLRTEYWTLVEGSAEAGVGDEELVWKQLVLFHTICIPQGTKHSLRTRNRRAVIVEIMRGEYREDDIIRYFDIYGRG